MYRQVDENIWEDVLSDRDGIQSKQSRVRIYKSKCTALYFRQTNLTLRHAIAPLPPARAPRHITRINQIATIYSGEEICEKTFQKLR